ncbi:Oidioi.mRNA.OKI2018_I69.PAR.g10293.t1.cds [Oikopleura dioica]|uniref:Oidioi.mRNA.OKI2018_I69.PAR.g10293.t1.cds n=1 Tax=Oikopleura dioica TaxID=34765 RepID=A0ABN7RQ20_OIKDI|nr:Oidioi.mRNA.OKI2018_I69.PAR.g10293.t1.cds [Oikopleura dioica]
MGSGQSRNIDPTQCPETCSDAYACTSITKNAASQHTDYACRLNENARIGLIAGFSALAFLLFVLIMICCCLKCRRNKRVVPTKKNSPDRCGCCCFDPEFAEPEQRAPTPPPPRTPTPPPRVKTPPPRDELTYGVVPESAVPVASDSPSSALSDEEGIGRVNILNTNVVRPTDFDPKSSSSSSSSSSDSE